MKIFFYQYFLIKNPDKKRITRYKPFHIIKHSSDQYMVLIIYIYYKKLKQWQDVSVCFAEGMNQGKTRCSLGSLGTGHEHLFQFE